MTKRKSDTKPVKDFINIAKEFCHLLEERDNKTALQLLQEAFAILPQLCLYGMKLPEINKISDYDPPRMTQEEWNELFHSLERKLDKFDVYQHVFDPFDPKDKEITQYCISGDISEIYQDIKPGLQVWEESNAEEKRNIIWNWWFLYKNHWGDHATTVFRTLHFLLNNYIEDENGDSVGIREDIKKFKPAKEILRKIDTKT